MESDAELEGRVHGCGGEEGKVSNGGEMRIK